jgi:hypothetical protein
MAFDSASGKQTKVAVTSISWHGWPDCYLIANGRVEAIIVPAIGRVMQLRLAGEEDGAFWENRALDGQLPAPAQNETDTAEWINFGGDKCWPAPQSSWPQQQGREWPPPVAFDSRPMEAVTTEQGVVLTSPLDPGFGVQVTRHVELDAEQPVMRIMTEYRKISGPPVRVGVWSITQMHEPERVFILLPEQSKFAAGYIRLMEGEPAELKIEGRLLSLVRHRGECVKIGADAGSLAWVGRSCVVRIDAEERAEPGAVEYPDGGCVTQVYTNPDPLPYVELETLGPLANLSVCDRIERSTVYTIMHRSMPDPDEEARKIFAAR